MASKFTKRRFIQTCPYGCCTEVGTPIGKSKKLANRLTRRRGNRFWKKEEE